MNEQENIKHNAGKKYHGKYFPWKFINQVNMSEYINIFEYINIKYIYKT